MRHACSILLTLIAAASFGATDGHAAQHGETVDRIVARVEGDIILLSEVQELAAYQQLVDSRSQSQDELLKALIEQWVVRTEAQEARFPVPASAEIDAEVGRIQGTFPSAQAYHDRLAAAGLTPQTLRRIIEQQVYLERYLDYKFRPAIQIEDAAIESYYQNELTPTVRARGQTPPPLDEVSERIREVLIQRAISERANTWFDETKARLQIEIAPPAGEGKR